MFNPNADPEAVAARAAELSLEQLDRLDTYTKKFGVAKASSFYNDMFEKSIANEIARLMSSYAVLKGYVPESRITR